MKRSIRISALLMAMLLGASSLPLTAYGSGSSASEEAVTPDQVLFSSSFESDDPTAEKSVSDNGYYANI